MLYWMCKKSGMQLTGPQLQHAIKRNFGGLDLEDIDTYSIFKSHLKDLEHEPDLSLVNDKVMCIISNYMYIIIIIVLYL